MNTIEKLYENATGIVMEDIKRDRKDDYILEIGKINPSKCELEKMMEDVDRKIEYYGSPKAKKKEMKIVLQECILGFFLGELFVNVIFIPIAMLCRDVDAGSRMHVVLGTEIAMAITALVMFGIYYWAKSEDYDISIRTIISDLKVARLAMNEYGRPLGDESKAPA